MFTILFAVWVLSFLRKRYNCPFEKKPYLQARVFMLCVVEIGQVVREERILSVINVFSVLYRFRKGRGPPFKLT